MTDYPLTITRTFSAPRQLVWDCYTRLEHLQKWWGPAGATWLHGSLDLTPGGKFHYGMTLQAGMEMWGRFVYREIDPISRLVFITSFSDAGGGIAAAPFPTMERYPREVLNEALFEESGSATRLTLRGGPHDAGEAEREFFRSMLPGMQQGFAGTFGQLERLLAALQAGG